MTAARSDGVVPSRDECIRAAGEIYGAILADPIRREQIRVGREAYLATQTAAGRDGASARVGGLHDQQRNTHRKST